jgi:hypothetical protein
MAKGKSSIRQKADYQRKKMYTPKQQMSYVPCDCDPKRVPMFDEDANEFKMTGGFKRNQICPKHFIALSVNGTCIECD